ncbi:hypothetical protein GCM10009844_19930 [Nocardioides koreensis]|uniref:DUF7144 domain-containing protein n=1 Tax=Nocardioides koreensis TaxID=433651 RepID=A0ABN2ZPH6_9ACTN
MTDYATQRQAAQLAQSAHAPRPARSPQAMASDYTGWAGWMTFAALMLMLAGSFHLVQGIVALVRDDYYPGRTADLAVDVSFTTWGWVLVLVGALAVLTGAFLLAGTMWARVVGTVIACTSAIVNFGFLAAYPFWSALVIGLDVLIVLALTVHGGAIRDRR